MLCRGVTLCCVVASLCAVSWRHFVLCRGITLCCRGITFCCTTHHFALCPSITLRCVSASARRGCRPSSSCYCSRCRWIPSSPRTTCPGCDSDCWYLKRRQARSRRSRPDCRPPALGASSASTIPASPSPRRRCSAPTLDDQHRCGGCAAGGRGRGEEGGRGRRSHWCCGSPCDAPRGRGGGVTARGVIHRQG